MKKSKKFLSIFLSILMCISCLGIVSTAFAADTSVYEEDIEAAVALAESQPVVPDKGTNISTFAMSGTYPTRKGVILATNTNASLGGKTFVGHAAIIYNSSTVVESLSKGVTTGKNNWNTTKSKCWGVTVKGTTTAQDASAANWCYNKIGKPYNYVFTNVSTREKFYCSQLVWASFKDLYGIDLNTSTLGSIVTPMELVNTDKTSIIYSKT